MADRAAAARPLASKGLRYLVTGGSAAVVDTGVFALLLRAGLAIVPAACLSFLAASVWNYWLSSRHVFGAGRSITGYFKFLAAALVGAAINIGLTTWLATHTPLPPIAAKVVGIGVAFIFNFTINVFVVFRDRSRPDAS